MRFHELFEYSDLSKEKENIIKTISGLDASDENQAKLLDRIYRLLNSETVGTRISSAFETPVSDEKFSQSAKQNHIIQLTKIISDLDADYAAMNKFLDRIEDGTAININELSKNVNSLHAVFNGDPVALKCFNELKMYGVGQLQKGPGEFALALMSPKIRLAAGEGDLEIDGIGKVELKAATGDGGGRLGAGGVSQTVLINTLMKFNDVIPATIERITSAGKGSIGLVPFVLLLNQELPSDQSQNRQLRQKIATALLKPNFGSYADTMGAAFANEDPQKVMEEYVKANFDWYKNKDDFDAFLIIGIGRGKTMMAKTGDDLVKLYRQKQITGFKISIIGTKSGAAREVFSQITPSAAGV